MAASLLCVGFTGATPAQAPLAELAALKPGGIVLFARNVTRLDATRQLVEAVCDAIGEAVRPFVAIDQEGGSVMRLRAGAAPIPSMMALGAARDAELARRAGAAIAADLRRAGCTIDFAPVLDLALEPQSPVIGTRSFGDDPQRVGALGAAVVCGLQEGGIAATIKHFPGHGATARDSHVELPVIPASAATLRERELLPFASGIAAGARAVMSAHVMIPALDERRPATLSHTVLTRILRDEYHFTGVCFTDCMEMDAIAGGIGTARGAACAVAAGADSVLVSHHLEAASAARDAIVAAVASGEISIARLEEAAARLDALRRWSVPPPAPVDGARVAHEAARAALTVVRGSIMLEPERPVTVVSFEGATNEGAQGLQVDHASLNLALRTRRFRSELFRAPLDPNAAAIEHLADLVRAQSGRHVICVLRRALRNAGQRAALAALLEAAPEALVVCAREPFDVLCAGRARHLVCTYGDDEASTEALADAIAGRFVPSGTLPVSLAAGASAAY
ncbi:MAG TPA: beta-N-acetylhexosaminidase [Candidatus Acidoferrales bacterium]|nr:beta-N-acetylhexosaminidase [Candidatus Acidoferrales bacterium]